jgi:hypothetical protein
MSGKDNINSILNEEVEWQTQGCPEVEKMGSPGRNTPEQTVLRPIYRYDFEYL